MLRDVTGTISAIISIYMLLIIIRIIISWFSPSPENYNKKGALSKLCDPYLNIFKKIPFFKIGYIDFSPIIALAALVIIGDIVNQFGMAGMITLGMIIAISVKALWNAISSLIIFLFIIVLIRFLIALIKPSAQSPVLTAIDSLLTPLSAKVASVFTKGSSYSASLMLLGIALIIIYFAGGFLAQFIISMAMQTHLQTLQPVS